jgi:hypothetical protein
LSEASLLSSPLSISASKIDILLGSLAGSDNSTTVLCFFFFFLDLLLTSLACWESCSILFGCPSGYRGSCRISTTSRRKNYTGLALIFSILVITVIKYYTQEIRWYLGYKVNV